MSNEELSDCDEGPDRRFDVQLFITHPTLDPARITAALALQPMSQQMGGARRSTPDGTILPGAYPDTRWRHTIRHKVGSQWFAERIDSLVDRLMPHKDFLTGLRSTGGEAQVIIAFLGDGHFGDTVRRETLAKLVELELDLGVECFAVPQA
jgi:hypothetical protein